MEPQKLSYSYSTQDSLQTPTWSGRSTGSAIRLRMLALGFTVAQYSGCDLAMANFRGRNTDQSLLGTKWVWLKKRVWIVPRVIGAYGTRSCQQTF